jgi:hypothetical protein
MPQKVSLLDALANATPDDLADVEHQMRDTEKKLGSLKALRRVLSIKLNGKQPSQKKTARGRPPATPVGGTDGRRLKVAMYLLHSGPTRPAVIANSCDIPMGSITAVLDHEWFQKVPDGAALTVLGPKAAEGA